MGADDSTTVTDVVTATYDPDQDRSLSGAILDAIASYRDEDLTESEWTLYDDVDPDALDNIFQEGPQPDTVVEFDTRGVRVMLWRDNGVEIWVTGLPNTRGRAK